MRRLFYSDDDFGGLFRDKLEHHKSNPSPVVWNRIEAELQGKKTYRGRKSLWLLIGLVFITISSLYLYNQSTLNEYMMAHSHLTSNEKKVHSQKNVDGSKQDAELIYAKELSSTDQPILPTTNFTQVLRDVEQSLDILEQASFDRKPVSLPEFDDVPKNENIVYENIITLEPAPLDSFSITSESSEETNFDLFNENCFKGIYGGLAFLYGNYWLLTNSFQNNPNVTAAFSPLRQWSIQLGQRLNKKWSVESGIQFQQARIHYRSINQNKRMQTSVMVDNRIDFAFVQWPVALRYNITGDCNRSLELKAGYILSKYLKGTTTLSEYSFEFAPDEIKPYQHIVALGLETGVHLFKHVDIRYGIDATCNTAMLSTWNAERINDLYRPIPLTIAGRLGITFHK